MFELIAIAFISALLALALILSACNAFGGMYEPLIPTDDDEYDRRWMDAAEWEETR